MFCYDVAHCLVCGAEENLCVAHMDCTRILMFFVSKFCELLRVSEV